MLFSIVCVYCYCFVFKYAWKYINRIFNILINKKYKKKKKRSVTLYKERYNIIVVFCQWNNVKDFKVKFSFLNEMLYFLFYTQNNTVIISTSTYDKILDL